MPESIEQTAKRISPKLAVAIFMLYLPLYGNGAVTPAIAALSEAFPNESITLVSLIAMIPNLTTIAGSLLVPVLLRGKPRFRELGIVSLAIYAILGVLPAFVHPSIAIILIFRIICGFGVGLLFPLGATLIMRLVGNKDERSRQLGRGQSVGQAGGMVLTLLGGFLCSISWYYTFLSYAVVAFALIGFVVLYRTPEFPDEDSLEKEESVDGPAATPGKKGLPAFAWIFAIILMLMQTAYNTVLLYVSPLLVATTGADDVSGLAGVLLSMLTIAGAIGALFTGKLYGALGRFAGPVAMVAMGALGLGLVAFGSSIPLYAIGIFVTGICFSVIVPITVIEVGNWATAAALALASTITMICMNAGNFISTYVLGFLMGQGGSIKFPVIACAAFIVVLGIVWAVVNQFNKAYKVRSIH